LFDDLVLAYNDLMQLVLHQAAMLAELLEHVAEAAGLTGQSRILPLFRVPIKTLTGAKTDAARFRWRKVTAQTINRFYSWPPRPATTQIRRAPHNHQPILAL
jgi:hypothetical protein